MSENKFLSEINAEFNKKRQKRKEKIDTLCAELYAQNPKIEQIDNEILGIGYKMFSAVTEGKLTPEEASLNIGETIKNLNSEKVRLMAELGYPEDCLNPPYECEKCNDTGTVDGKLCTCYKQYVTKELYKNANLGGQLLEQTFANFNLDIFSTKPFRTEQLSPRENMKEILSETKEFVENFGTKNENFFFYGSSGLGKTYVSSCIANALIEKGYDVLYQSAGDIFTSLDSIRFGKANPSLSVWAERLISADLLIIDDLGTEFITSSSVSELFRIINTRIINKKSMIINTNLPLSDIKKVYSERIMSRILGCFVQFKFFGEDVRLI